MSAIHREGAKVDGLRWFEEDGLRWFEEKV
jgi:hypothetical protein